MTVSEWEYWKDEFWKSLARLHDEHLKNHAEIDKLIQETKELRAATEELRTSTAELRTSTEELRMVAEAHQRVVQAHQYAIEKHEERSDRLDVIVDWLTQKERAREKLEGH